MVKRYEPSCMHSNLYEEHGQGTFVLHEDYEALLAIVEQLPKLQLCGGDEFVRQLARLIQRAEELLRD